MLYLPADGHLKPLGKAITVRAWRIETTEGQTMCVTKIGRSPKDSREPVQSEQYARNDSQHAHRSASVDGVTPTTAPTPALRNVLYEAFCQQLRSLLKSAGELKPTEIGEALGLVRSQAADWLKRAEQDGYVERTSKRSTRIRLPPPLR